MDPADLTRRLVRIDSVTPRDGGAMDLLEHWLTPLGFHCTRLPFGDGTPERPRIENLYARLGTRPPHFCFAGHTDVVPPGALEDWSTGPFDAAEKDGHLVGRGAVDMKGAIACFVAAISRYLAHAGSCPGSISLLITGDEEGPGVDGTKAVVAWLRDQGEKIDHCLVGEPTNPDRLGQMIKIGRRGSLNAQLTVTGTQGHVGYPARADNPIPRLVRILDTLVSTRLDEGTDHFDPSGLQVTSIDVGNPATNVIPARADARFNIRFNDRHTGDSLSRWLHEVCASVAGETGYRLDIAVTGDAFLTEPGPFVSILSDAVTTVTGETPVLSTSGGTSDARFIKDLCQVAEFGLVGRTMHKIDEQVALADLEALTAIYARILDGYFTHAW